MHRTRTSARLLVSSALIAAACSSEPNTSLQTPSAAPTGLATSSVTLAPVLDDRDCDEFPTREDAQRFYEEAGGPRQDIHELDPDDNGRACDETGVGASPTPSSRSSDAQARPSAAAVPSPVRMSEQTTVSGSVAGPSGGSASRTNCESTDPSRCE